MACIKILKSYNPTISHCSLQRMTKYWRVEYFVVERAILWQTCVIQSFERELELDAWFACYRHLISFLYDVPCGNLEIWLQRVDAELSVFFFFSWCWKGTQNLGFLSCVKDWTLIPHSFVLSREGLDAKSTLICFVMWRTRQWLHTCYFMWRTRC